MQGLGGDLPPNLYPYSPGSDTRMCVRVGLCLSICLSVCLSICLSVCLSICLSVYLSICLSVCLSVCLTSQVVIHTNYLNYL